MESQGSKEEKDMLESIEKYRIKKILKNLEEAKG